MITRWLRKGCAAVTLALLTACSGTTAAVPTAAPATTAIPATSVPIPITAPQATVAPTSAPAATEPPVIQPADAPAPTNAAAPTSTPVALPASQGRVVLQLTPGDGPQQVGMTDGGPRSFRIGGDGTIRVLDNANKRVLIFGQGGERGRVIPITEAQDPVDFIINTKAEVYVLDRGGAQVLHYGRDNALIERLPINTDIATQVEGVMTNSNQDLFLVQNNEVYWSLINKGNVIAPEVQPLTRHVGTVTPRSPRAFQTVYQSGAAPSLAVNLISGQQADAVAPAVPEVARFFNVDRAMNLYFFAYPDEQGVDIWRVQPDGVQLGGARVGTDCAARSWRNFYVDQAGAAWTMCVTEQGTTFTRYDLLDQTGNPLPEVGRQPAEVSWKPGASDNIVAA